MKNRYILGLTIGALWLTAASAGFGSWGLVAIGTPTSYATLGVLLVVAAGMMVAGTTIVKALGRSPGGFGQNSKEGRVIGRQFGWVLLTELVGIAAITAWCIHEHRFEWIAPLDILVVGLHFFPLARIFGVPRYNGMAVLFCVISLAALWVIPRGTHTGGAPSLAALPSLGANVVALVTAFAGLCEARRFNRANVTGVEGSRYSQLST
jgi:hypothetical protein